MRKSLAIFAVVAVSLLVVGTIVFAYASMQNNLNSSSKEQQTNAQIMQNMWPLYRSDNFNWSGHFMMRGRQMFGAGQCSGVFLRNATLSTVQGSVVTETRNILILNTSSGEIHILIPREWNIGSQIVSGATLFNGTFASSGQNVTLKVLETTLASNANFSINEMISYQATNATGTQADAVLPFNIQPNN